MAYKTVSARRLARKSRRNFITAFIIIVLLIYVTINWILPVFVNSLGFITGSFNSEKKITQVSDNPTLAPPVLNIPYEATNSGQINIGGYAPPSSKVKIYIDDELKDIVDVQSDGIFLASNIELSLGTNNIYGKTVDENDQESLASKIIKLVYDNEKPTLEISEPADGKEVQGERKIRIIGKTEPGAQVFIKGSQTIVQSDGSFNGEYSLSDGDNTIIIKVQDQASNFAELTSKVIFKP